GTYGWTCFFYAPGRSGRPMRVRLAVTSGQGDSGDDPHGSGRRVVAGPNCACGPVKPLSPSLSWAFPRAPYSQEKTLLLGPVSHLTAISSGEAKVASYAGRLGLSTEKRSLTDEF